MALGYRWHIDTLPIPNNILVKVATVTVEPNAHIAPHTHITLELSMITSGVGEYRVGDLAYPVQAGDIVLFNNIEHHGMWNTGTQPLVNVALEFEPRFIWSDPLYSFDMDFLAIFFNRSADFRHKLDQDNPAYAIIRQQFQEVCQEFSEKQPCYSMIVKAKLLVLLANLQRYYNTATSDASSSSSRYRQTMEQVLAYIATHYAEELSTDTLADMMHVSRSHFFRLFREINGLSPKDYIIRLRVMAAMHMLGSTSTDVLEIAQTCGFNNLSNFYTAFKRITGKSPIQYRAHPYNTP